MPIEHNKDSTTITGDSLTFWRWCQMKAVVGLECKGIRVTRGRVVWKVAKKALGMKKGDKHAVLAALEAKVEELREQQMHIDEQGRASVNGMEVN